MLFKLFLFLFIFLFVVAKVGGFILRALFGNATQHQHAPNSSQRTSTHKPSGSNVNIDYTPKNTSKTTQDFKGGDYIDYEEVKE